MTPQRASLARQMEAVADHPNCRFSIAVPLGWRTFLGGATALAAIFATSAAHTEKMWRIGFMMPVPAARTRAPRRDGGARLPLSRSSIQVIVSYQFKIGTDRTRAVGGRMSMIAGEKGGVDPKQQSRWCKRWPESR